MKNKRETISLRGGDILDVLECHQGNYGAPGMPRAKKVKPTKEQMIQINLLNKARRCRLKMLAYINYGDYFGTWTYRKDKRPSGMKKALKHFQKASRKIREFYGKAGKELYWFRNIEQGTRGAWHIHFVMNRIEGAAEVITKAWEHGGTYIVQIKESKYYDEDFTKLANYMTKDENSIEYRKDGSVAKSKIKEASYWTSKNMPIPKPKKKELKRWPKEIKPKKGYYIARMYEGTNPATGLPYRRYTMIRLNRRI